MRKRTRKDVNLKGIVVLGIYPERRVALGAKDILQL
jgi:hypothetical protein